MVGSLLKVGFAATGALITYSSVTKGWKNGYEFGGDKVTRFHTDVFMNSTMSPEMHDEGISHAGINLADEVLGNDNFIKDPDSDSLMNDAADAMSKHIILEDGWIPTLTKTYYGIRGSIKRLVSNVIPLGLCGLGYGLVKYGGSPGKLLGGALLTGIALYGGKKLLAKAGIFGHEGSDRYTTDEKTNTMDY